MRNFSSFHLLLLCLPLFATVTDLRGQALVPNISQLNFGTVTETAADSLQLTLTNTLNRPVTVDNLRFYTTYGAPAFSSRYNWFFIPANGSVTFWIRFAPRHNIYHNSELVIENDGLRGPVRIDLVGQGRFSKTYYSSTENLTEENLKNAFRTLLALNYDTLGYVTARDSMFMQIDNQSRNGQGAAQNTIESCYTGALAIGYVDRTDCQTTFSFNTEHTFPQSFFSSLEPMRSDLHHLFPCDDLSNNQRGNNPFGIVNSNIVWSGGGSKSDGAFFEPRDVQKGKASRSLLYFVLRYQDYSGFVQPQEPLLRQWHSTFTPDAVERRRNDDIFANQRNRNPFVDYPQFIERIHSVTAFSSDPAVTSIDLPTDTIVYGFVAPGNSAVYTYLVVNNGNQPVGLSNFSLSQPAVFSFSSGGTAVTLQPGEAEVIRITANPSSGNAVLAYLTYNTTSAASPSLTVPIYLNDPLVNAVSGPEIPSVALFPNPASEQLCVRTGFSSSLDLSLTDLAGRLVFSMNDADPAFTTLDLSALPAGSYLLELSSDGMYVRRTVLKR